MAIRNACERLGTYSLEGLRGLHQLRALPDVPEREFYWARPRPDFSIRNTKATAAEIDFDDAFLYTKSPKPSASGTIPTQTDTSRMIHQGLSGAGPYSEDKIPYELPPGTLKPIATR